MNKKLWLVFCRDYIEDYYQVDDLLAVLDSYEEASILCQYNHWCIDDLKEYVITSINIGRHGHQEEIITYEIQRAGDSKVWQKRLVQLDKPFWDLTRQEKDEVYKRINE